MEVVKRAVVSGAQASAGLVSDLPDKVGRSDETGWRHDVCETHQVVGWVRVLFLFIVGACP